MCGLAQLFDVQVLCTLHVLVGHLFDFAADERPHMALLSTWWLHVPQGMTYGWLTCLNATYFIKRVAEHTYQFTNALYTDTKNPTVLEMLLCR